MTATNDLNPYHTEHLRKAWAEGWRQQELGMPADINAPVISTNIELTAFWKGWDACTEALDA